MALTGAERMARLRVRQRAGEKPVRFRRPKDRRSRPQQWQDAVAVLLDCLDAYQDWSIPAYVIAIVPTANREKATVRVRIGFRQKDPRILPDMAVKVTFVEDAAPERTSAAD